MKELNLERHQIEYLKKKLNIKKMDEIEITVLKNLRENIKKIKDPREQGKIKYKVWDVIIYVFLSCLSGIDTWEEIVDFIKAHKPFFRAFLQMTGGIPSSQTIERVMSLIDPKALEETLVEFYKTLVLTSVTTTDIVSIDGRVDCGSSRKETHYKESVSPLNVLNAYSTNVGICLASEMIKDKSNEIPTIPIILERFQVKDTIITWDALNTQKKNVEAVIEKRGNYVVPIKKNHFTFYNELELYFDTKKQEQIRALNLNSGYKREEEKSHSSIIVYEYFQINDIKWYENYKDWSKMRSIGMVKKTIEKNKEKKVEYRYYISSLSVEINEFSRAIRNHWNVENKLHWHLDFTFREDKNTTMNKRALMNLQTVNKLCLGILNRLKPYHDNVSLRRIKNRMKIDFENQLTKNMCYLMLG